MNKWVLGLVIGLVALAVSGVAYAFTPGLIAAGYSEVNSWTYRKVNGACQTTVMQSGSKFWVFSKKSGRIVTQIYPISTTHVLDAANLAEGACLIP